MENKSKFLQPCHQRKCVKRQIVFGKKRDVKTIPKLLSWESRYQHTMFDFLKKDKINKENKSEIVKSNILCENLCDTANPNIESSVVVLNNEGMTGCISGGNFRPQKSGGTADASTLKQHKIKDFDCSGSRFNLIDKENLNHLYDVPIEFKSKFIREPNPNFVKSFSNPFETGSLNYNNKNLGKLFSMPENI